MLDVQKVRTTTLKSVQFVVFSTIAFATVDEKGRSLGFMLSSMQPCAGKDLVGSNLLS